MCNGDDLILNPLFNFEPMKGLAQWGDVRMFMSASNSACKFILNMLKAFNLSDGWTVVKRVTVIEALMDKAVAILVAVMEPRVCRMRRRSRIW